MKQIPRCLKHHFTHCMQTERMRKLLIQLKHEKKQRCKKSAREIGTRRMYRVSTLYLNVIYMCGNYNKKLYCIKIKFSLFFLFCAFAVRLTGNYAGIQRKIMVVTTARQNQVFLLRPFRNRLLPSTYISPTRVRGDIARNKFDGSRFVDRRNYHLGQNLYRVSLLCLPQHTLWKNRNSNKMFLNQFSCKLFLMMLAQNNGGRKIF